MMLILACFVHNVAAIISYDRKQLLDIRKAITKLNLDGNYNLKRVSSPGRSAYSEPGLNPQDLKEEAAGGRRSGIILRLRQRANTPPMTGCLLVN